jgi:hypothetical protein
MYLNGTPEDVFPLLCPVREYDWIQTWQCEMIYTDSGVAELDCVFKTNFPSYGPEETWVVSKYEFPSCIEFVRINSIRSIRYTIKLARQENGNTQATWEQVITGLNKEGDDFVAGYTDDKYNDTMNLLKNMINHYLKTGEMLKIQPR